MTILLEAFEVLWSFYAADCQLLSSLSPSPNPKPSAIHDTL
jgi:hypothetical protein